MTTQQPEALRLAELLELAPEDGIEPQTAEDAAAGLRRQHARIAELESQLEAIGAGGVSGPLMSRTDSKERAGRFTKKPVTIDAWLIDFGNKPLPDWVNEAFRTEAIDWCPAGEGLYINTLEGHMLGTNGSWLIKGVQGELYSCKPDIFAATYERASLAASAGSEPVAHLWQHCETGRTRIVMPDMIVDADASWQVVGPLYLGATPPTAQAEGWTKLPGTLPKPGTPVLLDIGKEFPIRAMWAAKFTLPVGLEDDSGFGEHDERTDEWYCPEGWYEWNEHEEIHWRVTETPRAWAPLPPTTSAGSGNGE